jgi:hypothetical protein
VFLAAFGWETFVTIVPNERPYLYWEPFDGGINLFVGPVNIIVGRTPAGYEMDRSHILLALLIVLGVLLHP